MGAYDDILQGTPEKSGTYDDILKPAAPKNRMREAGKQLPSPMQGFVTAMQGPLFGFLDEITGGVQAGKALATGEDTQKAYTQYRDLIRGAEQQYRQDYPTVSAIAPAMAAAPIYVAGPQIAMAPKAGATAAQNLGRAAFGAGLTAAGYGAISALGESEGEGGNLLSDVLKGAASSGVTGGAAVPVAAILGKAAGGAARGGSRVINAMIPGGGRIGEGMTNSYAQRKVAEQLIRDTPEIVSIKNPMDRLLAYQRYLGAEGRVMDLGGAQTLRTAKTLAELPGKGPEMFRRAANQRAAWRGPAIVREADKALGTGGALYRGTIDDLEQQAITASRPYYAQIENLDIPVQGGLREVLQKANKYLGGADEYAASIGITGKGLKDALAGTNVIGKSGLSVKTAVAPLSKFDALKQYLYDVEQGYVREGSKNQAAAIGSIRRQLTQELDNLSPKDAAGNSIYAMARNAYAGPSQLRDAAEIGRQAFAPDKDWKIADAIAGMSQSERDAMRIGLVQAVKEKAGTQAGQTWLMNNWKNPAVREKIQMAFGKDSGKFISELAKQAKMKNIESVGVGSQTGSIWANADDLGVEAVSDAGKVAAATAAGDHSGLWSALNIFSKNRALPEPIRNEMSRILTMQGPKAREALMEMGQSIERLYRQQQAIGSVASRYVGRQNPWLTNEANNEQ